jgi:hypothetical protein
MQDRSDEQRYATGNARARQPDQAEGERSNYERDPSSPEARRPTPSQAEGDRDLIEEDLREKGRR